MARRPPGPGQHGGEINYRLARQGVVAAYRKGRLARHEVCDAHPELLRAARSVGTPTEQVCPICADDHLVLVSYVFGPRLPAHGRCVTSQEEIAQLAARKGDFSCYVVEACVTCGWNHLARAFALAPARGGAARTAAH